MNRTSKKFTIQASGTPQPVVGSYVTATTVAGTPDNQGETLTSLPINDSSMFLQGDYVLAISAALTNPQVGRVQKVVNSTTINVRGLTLTRTGGVFGTGDFVALFLPVNRTYIQSTPGNTGLLFVGTAGLVKGTFVNVIATMQNFAAGTQPIEYSDTRYYAADPMNASDLWIDGSTGDGYLPSYGVA
jgi:hypothetical protein